jgi:hypothetical protein
VCPVINNSRLTTPIHLSGARRVRGRIHPTHERRTCRVASSAARLRRCCSLDYRDAIIENCQHVVEELLRRSSHRADLKFCDGLKVVAWNVLSSDILRVMTVLRSCLMSRHTLTILVSADVSRRRSREPMCALQTMSVPPGGQLGLLCVHSWDSQGNHPLPRSYSSVAVTLAALPLSSTMAVKAVQRTSSLTGK